MRSSAAFAALLLGFSCLAGCSGDTTASENKGAVPVAADSKTAAQDFAELSALRPRDRTPDQDVQLAAFLAEVGRPEEAFATLADAAVKGYSNLEHLRTEPRFAVLRTDPRWEQVELFVDVNGGQNALPDVSAKPPQQVTAQRPTPPGSRVNVPAPDWSLTDASGNVVKLSDLRGKTVIMDFWATWCGPCKRSMPEIDKFTRQYAREDLVVLSVNVWERSTDMALEWYNQQGYAMKLLFGGRDLTTAYEVSGIPHLCLIDPDGIIRYSQAGFHPQVLDHLLKLTGTAAKEG